MGIWNLTPYLSKPSQYNGKRQFYSTWCRQIRAIDSPSESTTFRLKSSISFVTSENVLSYRMQRTPWSGCCACRVLLNNGSARQAIYLRAVSALYAYMTRRRSNSTRPGMHRRNLIMNGAVNVIGHMQIQLGVNRPDSRRLLLIVIAAVVALSLRCERIFWMWMHRLAVLLESDAGIHGMSIEYARRANNRMNQCRRTWLRRCRPH